MCGCVERSIWQSTKRPSLIKCMQGAHKSRLRRCRRCNGRMTKRCKTRRAILKKAGYPNCFTLSLWSPHSIRTNPNPQLTAAMIQSDWKKIGVQSKIVTHEWGEFIKRAINGEHDVLLIGGIGTFPDPDIWLQMLSSNAARNGINYSRWRNQA